MRSALATLDALARVVVPYDWVSITPLAREDENMTSGSDIVLVARDYHITRLEDASARLYLAVRIHHRHFTVCVCDLALAVVPYVLTAFKIAEPLKDASHIGDAGALLLRLCDCRIWLPRVAVVLHPVRLSLARYHYLVGLCRLFYDLALVGVGVKCIAHIGSTDIDAVTVVSVSVGVAVVRELLYPPYRVSAVCERIGDALHIEVASIAGEVLAVLNGSGELVVVCFAPKPARHRHWLAVVVADGL